VFHFLQGFWYRLLVDAKLVERQRAGPPIPEPRPPRLTSDKRPIGVAAHRP
jgi:hypothetical protein